jgi:hypothetical protein
VAKPFGGGPNRVARALASCARLSSLGRGGCARALPLTVTSNPNVTSRRVELHSWDAIEGLVSKDGPQVEVLTAVALWGGLVAAWPTTAVTAQFVVDGLQEHWRTFGLPGYAQFDNDTIFQGPPQHPGAVGRVIRLCLSLGVVPVFTPPRETGFQAAIASCNGRWQAKVWARFQHATLVELCDRSTRYVAAARQRSAARIEAAPPRRPFPRRWRLNLQGPLRGRLVYLRRTDAQGLVAVLGERLVGSPLWVNRLVRCEVDVAGERIRFHSLRRREPQPQPLLAEVAYRLPQGSFHE